MSEYQLIATSPDGREQLASFAKSDTLAGALECCKREFPPSAGYTRHELWDIETGEVYDSELLEMLFEE